MRACVRPHTRGAPRAAPRGSRRGTCAAIQPDALRGCCSLLIGCRACHPGSQRLDANGYAILDSFLGAGAIEELMRSVHAVIRAGRSVRLQLREFDPTTRVLPFDLGSWASQPDWPTDQLGNPIADLNDPSTCYGPPDRGCAIRQINGGVQPLSSARAEFTVRDRGSASCPG